MLRKSLAVCTMALSTLFSVSAKAQTPTPPTAKIGFGGGESVMYFRGKPTLPPPFEMSPSVTDSPIEFQKLEFDFIRDEHGQIINHNWWMLTAKCFVKDNTEVQLQGSAWMDFGNFEIDALGANVPYVRTVELFRGERFTLSLFGSFVFAGGNNTQWGGHGTFFKAEPRGFFEKGLFDESEVTEWGMILHRYHSPDGLWYRYWVTPVNEPWNIVYDQTPEGVLVNPW